MAEVAQRILKREQVQNFDNVTEYCITETEIFRLMIFNDRNMGNFKGNAQIARITNSKKNRVVELIVVIQTYFYDRQMRHQ